ncbi:hypothetical protein [Myxococcus sp. Y35]|uniref:hypothetical protein n=1 Tax=Pseudomyxococcus flavus TaxID=3115648 RepID=UPI003CF2C745
MSIKISNTQTTARSSAPTATEKKQAWQGVLDAAVNRMNDPEIKGSLKHLGDNRINQVKEKVQADMEAFIRNNPNATTAEIKAEAEKTTSKHETNAVINKMRDDNFFNNLMNRRKELLKDMWE